MRATKKKPVSTDRGELVQRTLDTYVTGDRAEIERLLAPDFEFTSPYDDHIDRAAYFEKCWPAAGTFAPFEYLEIMSDGDDSYVTYTGGPAEHRFHNTERFEFRGAQVSKVEVFFGLPSSHQLEPTAEQAIRQLLDDRALALHDKDGARAVALYSADASAFGLGPPLVVAGTDLLDPRSLDAWFATWRGGIETTLRDVKIVVGGQSGFVTALENMRGTKADGERIDFWLRASFGVVCEQGAWKIANVHESIPFAMDGTFCAIVDVTP